MARQALERELTGENIRKNVVYWNSDKRAYWTILDELEQGVIINVAGQRIDLSDSIFIRGEVRSSKNSKRVTRRWTTNRSTGKRVLATKVIDSKAVAAYRSDNIGVYEAFSSRFRDLVENKRKPYYVEFLFIRSTKGLWDFNNMTELVQDLMVETGWIDGDDVYNMLPVPPLPPKKPFLVDKEFPGVIIRVL